MRIDQRMTPAQAADWWRREGMKDRDRREPKGEAMHEFRCAGADNHPRAWKPETEWYCQGTLSRGVRV